MAGQGQAPARQACGKAVRPIQPGGDLSKMCGSGMRAMFGHDMLAHRQRPTSSWRAVWRDDQRAAPDVCAQASSTAPAPSTTTWPWTVWRTFHERGKAMGVFAESCVAKHAFTREAMDQYAITLHPARQGGQRGRQFRLGDRARDAVQPEGRHRHQKFDEQPFKAKLDKIPGLKPAFKKDGPLTAATSSSISTARRRSS